MIFIELFAPAGALAPERLRRTAVRLGSLQELDSDPGEAEEIAPALAQVFGSLFQVVVHECPVWVVSEDALAADDRPRFAVRIALPAPWRKDLSATLITTATRILAEESGLGEAAYREPLVQVHVVGITEGSLGLHGQPTTSQGVVDLMNQPFAEDAEQGRALKDPICGMLVPLDGDSPTLTLDGTLYAFCCKGCRADFQRRQQKEAARAR
ncbi:YHS domain protein [Nocardiopsis coralliicola]